MRVVVFFVVLVGLVACTKPNPNTCCVTQAQCDELGADALRPCEAGQACQASTCVASECDTSADCTSSDAPICSLNLCVSSCATDGDCADVAGRPYCTAESTCVGCTEAAQCPASAAICDSATHACRGCSRDDECPSGVCLDADGVCADAAAIIWIRPLGMDVGDCSSTAQCQSVGYALQKVSSTRNVIRMGSGTFAIEPTTHNIARSVTFDGVNTTLQKDVNIPLFSLLYSGRVTIEGLVVKGATNSPADATFVVDTGSTLRIAYSQLVDAVTRVTNGSLELRDSTVRATSISLQIVNCNNGTFTARSVNFERAFAGTTNCQVKVQRSRFAQATDFSLNATGGLVLVENNLVTVSAEFADLMIVNNTAPGSTVRFNTFVNTSGVSASGVALECDATVDVTSNIFAYASTRPHGPSVCSAKYSLYDSVALPTETVGEGNKVGDGATFFRDRTNLDLHLSPNSLANDAAQPGLGVADDLEGTPRAATPDIGAYEAP